MHRQTRNKRHEHSKSSIEQDNSESDRHEEKPKKGIIKQIEVIVSKFRHEGLKKGVHFFLAISIITSAIIAVANNINLQYDGGIRKTQSNMVQLLGEDYSNIQSFSQITLAWKLGSYNPSYSKHRNSHEKFEEGNCKAMHSWQLEAYPNCNLLHETDMSKTRHVGRGGFRDVWAMEMWDGTKLALKTLADRKKFTHRENERHRRDAVAYSLLTSSKHIPNIYGYCSNSGIFDFSANGSLEEHIFKTRRKNSWSTDDILRYSWQATTALADVHAVGMKGKSASIAHTDISIDQFLWVDGMYKLNDFNRARFIRWDVVENKPCKFYISKNPGRYRSPEEYRYDYLTEKIDVYSLGNVLYSILTKQYPFSRANSTVVAEEVQDGKRPSLSGISFRPKVVAVAQAIKMCWVQNPKDRASARDVDLFLRSKLLEFNVSMF